MGSVKEGVVKHAKSNGAQLEFHLEGKPPDMKKEEALAICDWDNRSFRCYATIPLFEKELLSSK